MLRRGRLVREESSRKGLVWLCCFFLIARQSGGLWDFREISRVGLEHVSAFGGLRFWGEV